MMWKRMNWMRIATAMVMSWSVSANAAEQCNGIDDDGNGQIDEGFDADGDLVTDCGEEGFYIGPEDNCNGAGGPCSTLADCNDADNTIYPSHPGDLDGAYEACNGEDENCDGRFDEVYDTDNDTYTRCGTSTFDGSTVGADCDDTISAKHPGAVEYCDAYDDNCNGVCDESFDSDMDTYSTCGTKTDDASGPGGYCTVLAECNDEGECSYLEDCNDQVASIHPTAKELCEDSVDQDCNGLVDDGCVIINDDSSGCNCKTSRTASQENAYSLGQPYGISLLGLGALFAGNLRVIRSKRFRPEERGKSDDTPQA